jgi:hypothetical protein
MFFNFLVFLSALVGVFHLSGVRKRRAAANRKRLEIYRDQLKEAFDRAMGDKAAASALTVYKLIDEPPSQVEGIRPQLKEEMRRLEEVLKQYSSWTRENQDPEHEQRMLEQSLGNLRVACERALEPEISEV